MPMKNSWALVFCRASMSARAAEMNGAPKKSSQFNNFNRLEESGAIFCTHVPMLIFAIVPPDLATGCSPFRIQADQSKLVDPIWVPDVWTAIWKEEFATARN